MLLKRSQINNFFQYLPGFLVVSFMIGLMLWSNWHANKEFKEAASQCRDLNAFSKKFPEVFPLQAVFGKTQTEKRGSFEGSFFLVMGGISGHEEENGVYMLKYAYKDNLGTKLMTDRIDNNSKIRIVEEDTDTPSLKVYRSYSNFRHGEPIMICQEEEPVKIFSVPKGTIFKGYQIDLTK